MSSILDKKRGRNVRKIREFKDMKQEEVADKLNMTQQNYSKLENGEYKFTSDKLKTIAEVLGVSPEVIDTFEETTNFINCSFTNSFGFNGINYNYLADPKQVALYEEQLAMVKEKLRIAEEELKKAKKTDL